MLVGAVKLGGWVIFDEINRIEPETLSIVSEFIYVIQSAMKANLERVQLAGKDCVLNGNCHVFITMNPGYVGKLILFSKTLFPKKTVIISMCFLKIYSKSHFLNYQFPRYYKTLAILACAHLDTESS